MVNSHTVTSTHRLVKLETDCYKKSAILLIQHDYEMNECTARNNILNEQYATTQLI